MLKPILFLLFTLTSARADPPHSNIYILTKAYSVTILGTSNLRNWKDSVGIVTGDIVADLNEDASIDLYSIHIKMDVRSIKSNIGNALDNKTYRALKAAANPQIIFLLDVPVKLMQISPGQNALSLKGYLTLAGICRPVTMQVNGLKLENGKLQFEGSETINMTDYGIKPPNALFGTIKAHPQITINFETNFTNKQDKL